MTRYLLLLIFFLPATLQGQDYKWDTIAKKDSHDCIVHVQVPNGAYGTGVIVGITERDKKRYATILTCWHVVEDAGAFDAIKITYSNGFIRRKARIIKWNSKADIVVIEASVPDNYEAIPIAKNFATGGDLVECVGLGGGVSVSGTKVRRFKSVVSPVSNKYFIACNDCIVAGDSGGPIINDKGQLVGLMRAGGYNVTGFQSNRRKTTYWALSGVGPYHIKKIMGIK